MKFDHADFSAFPHQILPVSKILKVAFSVRPRGLHVRDGCGKLRKGIVKTNKWLVLLVLRTSRLFYSCSVAGVVKIRVPALGYRIPSDRQFSSNLHFWVKVTIEM